MREIIAKTIFSLVASVIMTCVFSSDGVGKELSSTDFTKPRGENIQVEGGMNDLEGWNPVVESDKSREHVVLPVTPGQNFDVTKGTIELVVKRRKAGGAQYGHNTLFSFARADHFSPVTVYLVLEGRKGYLLVNHPRGNENVWGRVINIPEPIDVGKPFHMAFTWGPDPENNNGVYYNGVKLRPASGKGGGILTPLLAGVNRIVIGATFGAGANYPYVDAQAVELKFMSTSLSDTAKTSFDIAFLRPTINSITDDTFSVPGISGKLTTGDTVTVSLTAEPGGKASFDMGKVKGVPMTESPETPGLYTGSYTIKPGDDFEDGRVVGQFTTPTGIAATPLAADNVWTIDTGTTLTLEVDKKDLPADETAKTKIKVSVTDVNGNPVRDHQVRVDLATTEEYTDIVGLGSAGENVGAEVEAAWKSVTDSWGEVEFDYRSGFAAKTVIVTAKDLTTGSVGVDYITSYIDALIDIALTRPVSKAAARRGLLYYMEVEASRTELTADGRSRSVIRAYVYDPNGNPVEGDTIEFTLDQDNGTLRTIKAVTDKNGRATAEYRAGKNIGIVQVTATDITRGLQGNVSITLLSDAPAKIYLAARPDSLPADGFSRSDIEVKVTDVNDNPNEDTEVLFSLVKGSGKLRNDSVVTDRFGEAENTLISGKDPGIATIKATVKSKVPTEEELDRAKNVLFARYSDLDDEMEVTKWLVRKGDEVKEGSPLCEYSIRGEQLTLLAPYDLRVDEIVVETWDDLEVGQTLAIVTPVDLP